MKERGSNPEAGEVIASDIHPQGNGYTRWPKDRLHASSYSLDEQ